MRREKSTELTEGAAAQRAEAQRAFDEGDRHPDLPFHHQDRPVAYGQAVDAPLQGLAALLDPQAAGAVPLDRKSVV